ncbi:MAG: Crp/Fnr family transcriptional regulator [Halomonadaceae bacterium]|nr:MAG: Crp/Fnr family transcriptional regulator [Halomonadaceae bacterium]
MPTINQATYNRLLAASPQASLGRLLPCMKPVHLPLGKVIYEADQPIEFVYFPTDCIVSLLYVMADGASAEISVVGFEGITGIAVLMGANSSTSQAVVQSAGTAFRLPIGEIRREFDHSPAMRAILLRYIQTLITQMSQTAVCNRHHSIEQQLCRWLLLSLDRLPGNELIMTQELIANMLGVRREGVTEAAGRLQRQRVIRYQRGRITIIDRAKLEALCCECYAVVKREADRLQPCPGERCRGGYRE